MATDKNGVSALRQKLKLILAMLPGAITGFKNQPWAKNDVIHTLFENMARDIGKPLG